MRGDDEVFIAGLVELARRDVRGVLTEICALGEPGSWVVTYEGLAAPGRRLAVSAAVVAGHEREHPA